MGSFLSGFDIPAFLMAMVLIELTPGPNMGWLAAFSAQHGRRAGGMAVIGITLGLLVQVVASATGLSSLLASFPVAYEALRWAGVLFMVWLAWEAFAVQSSATPVSALSSHGFKRGLIANILNPKALVFYVVVIGQFADPQYGSVGLQILVLGLVHLLISIIVHSGIVLLGARLGSAFETWRTSLAARLFFSLSLLAIAVWIAISTG